MKQPFRIGMKGLKHKVAALGALATLVTGGAALGLVGSALAQASGHRDPVNPPKVGIFTTAFPSALNIDVAHETVTLPLYEGRTADGEKTWYVVTDSSGQADAQARGVNYAGKLLNALGTAAVQRGHFDHGQLVFGGTVNFGLHHVLVPSSPNGFPPSAYAPGAEGDANYSPLVDVAENGHNVVLNAPQVANDTGKSLSVVAIDYVHRTVTLSLLGGWVDGQFTLYLHTDASSKLVAALEDSTYAPNLNAAPGIANDEPPSARAAIIPVVNGPRGDTNPIRQGLQSSLLGEGDPFNIAQEQPSDPVHYTPIWDVSPVQWTAAAIAAGKRVQLHSQDDVRAEALAGNIVSAMPGTPNAGLGGINASGAISNCPIIVVFPGGPNAG
jgi:hypothetical protein